MTSVLTVVYLACMDIPQEAKPRTKVLKNGAVYDYGRGRIVANPGGGTTAITPQKSSEYKQARKEKAAALLRSRIREAHNSGDMTPVRSSAAAFAESGALLYQEVVLNPDAYPRDRLETWKTLGQAAEVLADPKQAQEQPQVVRHEYAVDEATRELIQAALAAKRQGADNNNYREHEVLDAKVTETPASGGEAE